MLRLSRDRLFQLCLYEAQPRGLPLRMLYRSSPTRKILGKNLSYKPWQDLAVRQEWVGEARVSLATAIVQVPTVTCVNGLIFPGVSFEQRHLTVEVGHRKLYINSGHCFPSILAANNLANSVTPDPSLDISEACSASWTAVWQIDTQKHGSFFNLSATICLKNRFAIRHSNSWCMNFCHFHVCLHVVSEGKHGVFRFLRLSISNIGVFNVCEEGFFLS